VAAATSATRLLAEERKCLSASGDENGVSFRLNALDIGIRFSDLSECVGSVVANPSAK